MLRQADGAFDGTMGAGPWPIPSVQLAGVRQLNHARTLMSIELLKITDNDHPTIRPH